MSSNDRPPTPDYTFLGQVVLAFRSRHGWAQSIVAANGGPSDTTQSAIEAGEWRSTRPEPTLAKVDAGLRWPAGTARRVLFDGLDVVHEVPRFDQGASISSQLPEDVESAEHLVEQLTDEAVLAEAQEYDARARRVRADAALSRAERHLQRLRFVSEQDHGGTSLAAAARTPPAPSKGRRRSAAADAAGEPEPNSPDDMEPR